VINSGIVEGDAGKRSPKYFVGERRSPNDNGDTVAFPEAGLHRNAVYGKLILRKIIEIISTR